MFCTGLGMTTTRDLLIDTMKQLLWERGYDATSPNQVLERSGVGKGSFYHHFKGKQDLAIAAMESRADELTVECDALLARGDSWLAKVEAYLRVPRSALKGCRMGRIAQDPSLEDRLLQAPMKRFFQTLHQRFTTIYRQAQQQGELAADCSAEALATATISVIQGSFVYGRAVGDDAAAEQAGESFLSLLKALQVQ